MSPASANLVFEAANLLLLTGALGFLFFKPIRRALEAERRRRGELEREARTMRADAEALVGEAKRARERLTAELEERRAEALAATESEAARVANDAKRREAARREELERELEALRRGEAERVAETLGRVAAVSVRRLLDALDGPALDVALVRGVCGVLAELPDQAKSEAGVESARPLGDEAKKLLEEALGHLVEAREVPELGAGVRVTTSAGQIDGSALAIARQAAREVSAAATERPGGDVG